MIRYKRNQIEEAISGVEGLRVREPSVELRNRIKRLLDTDRSAGRSPRAVDPERSNYAFYSGDSPGSGVEIWFSEYEAFAILTGLRLLGHGWPQSLVVSMMRRIRTDLEREHAHMLALDPIVLFDEAEMLRKARPGDMVFDVTMPVLLTIVSKPGAEPHALAIRRGADEALKFIGTEIRGGGAGTMFELAGIAHRLAQRLAETEPSRRGRG
jgi:hypothetical protein